MGPLLGRFHFVVEFLYPTALGRWFHLSLVRLAARTRMSSTRNDMNRGYHSRALEVRVEIVKGRVFVHPLCQLLDNLGYLVVCVPAQMPPYQSTKTPLGKVTVINEDPEPPIVAFVVDCGDADSVCDQVDYISEMHYDKRPIVIQSILSTHKHHDHTAGNRRLMSFKTTSKTIKHVFGGAVERVPGCNYPLSDADMLPLPKAGDNDMNDLIEVEAIATPGHTRGSLTYALRPKITHQSSAAVFLFTGDTMFSGGKGVTFEADFEAHQEDKESLMLPHTFIRASAADYATERCFTEIMARSVRPETMYSATPDRILIFSGHEYTSELLARQFTQAEEEACKWKNYSPSAFFEVASQFYVASHRRTLPHSSGKLLCAPSSLRRELLINPTMRRLKKRGEAALRAVTLWHTHFAKEKIADPQSSPSKQQRFGHLSASSTSLSGMNDNVTEHPEKTPSLYSRWNLDAKDVDSPIFTTLYSNDVDVLISDLTSGRISGQAAATRLQQMKAMLDVPPIGRRPIPNTLPSDRAIARSLLALALLGSTPSALTFSDSKKMKLSPPIVSDSDQITVSKRKLISVVYWLGLLHEGRSGQKIVGMINQLWKETQEYSYKLTSFELELNAEKKIVEVDEERSMESDLVELGALRWILFGIPERPKSWLGKFCQPCSAPIFSNKAHPIKKSGMQKNSGELVRHDLFVCLMCRSAAGCPCTETYTEDSFLEPSPRPSFRKISSSATDDEDYQPSIEVSPLALGALMREI